MERTLLDRASKPVVILRPCAIHGVGSTHPREWWFVKRMMDRRPFIPLAYRGESRFHTSAAKNIAALIGIVLENPRTRILNVADKTAFSLIEIGRAIAHHLHYSGRFVPVNDDGYPPAIGATPWSVPAPFTLDNGAAIALGYAPFAYDETVGPVCDWLMRTGGTSDWKSRFPVLASYPYEQFDYAAENEYLARSYRD